MSGLYLGQTAEENLIVTLSIIKGKSKSGDSMFFSNEIRIRQSGDYENAVHG